MKSFGLEAEFTVFDLKGSHISPFYDLFAAQRPDIVLFSNLDSNLERNTPWLQFQGGVGLRNGGRIYSDGGSVEYASPECETLEELVCVDKAGDLVIKALYSNDNYSEESFLMKRTAVSSMRQDKSWGAHENYLISKNLWRDICSQGSYYQLLLEAHLVTRQVYTGSGHLQIKYRDSGAPYLVFWISPRTKFIAEQIGGGSRSNRAIINNRDESHAWGNLRNFKRLHLVCGDMNRSDWSVYLKFGTTALLLTVLELSNSQEIAGIAESLRISNPLYFLRSVSRPFHSEQNALNYRKAIIIQNRLLDFVRSKEEILVDFFKETKSVLSLWGKSLSGIDDLKNPSFIVQDKFDWLIKRKVFEEMIEDSLFGLEEISDKKLQNKLKRQDFAYHRLNNKKDFYQELVDKGWVKELYSKEKAEYYLYKPPLGRAWKRVKLIEYLNICLSKPFIYSVDWGIIKVRKGVREESIVIDDRSFEELKFEIDQFCQKDKG
jgi:hypothetical protein